MTNNNNVKILTLDIETAPFEALTWGLWDQNIGLNQIQKETSILSYAAKWLGSNTIIYEDTSGRGADQTRNDWKLLDNIWHLLDEADIVVAQNGVKFDIKRLNARLIMHNFPPYSPLRVIDTMLAAKKIAAFTSNRLEWLGSYLAGEGKRKSKKFDGMAMWKECLADNPIAWQEMKLYNIKDTRLCEKVYLKLRPWMNQHPNIGVYKQASQPVCPKCGSQHVQARGTQVTQNSKYHRYHCQSCGGWSRGKQMLLALNERRKMLT